MLQFRPFNEWQTTWRLTAELDNELAGLCQIQGRRAQVMHLPGNDHGGDVSTTEMMNWNTDESPRIDTNASELAACPSALSPG